MNRNRYKGLLDEIEDALGSRKRMLTTKEFAQLTGRHYMTVWGWCARKEIPSTQKVKGGPYLIHFHQLVDFFEGVAA